MARARLRTQVLMVHLIVPLSLLLHPIAPAHSQPPSIRNEQTALEACGTPGKWTGVVVKSGGREVTRVELSSGERWTASRAETGGGKDGPTLSLRSLSTAGTGGTPELAAGSFVRFSLARSDPFPKVEFRLEVRAFDRAAWERAWPERCPMHFLCCSSPDAELYYFHGLLAPTPKTDPYPFSFRDMRAEWAEGWSTAPAIAALTVPAVALWTPSTGRLVAYSFQQARSTDRSDKDLSVAYCSGTKADPGQFFALIWPYQRGFNQLTYPTAPTTVHSRLDLLYDLKTGPTGDVNRFVFDHLWSRYRELLPEVPRMNDLGWMAERTGIEESLGGSAIFGRVRKASRSFAAACFRDDTEVFGGSFRGVDLAYRRHDGAALAAFRQEVEKMLARARWETIDGEECVYWRYPSEGAWEDSLGGEAATTTRNVQQFGFAGALLAMYLHEPSDRLWRFVEGCYHWARHCLYTRGDICDIPCSMFTLQTSQLAMNFLMNLHYSLRGDPDPHKREMAAEAFRLAETVVWRNANVTTDDPDETDALDPSFLMPGNQARFWLGQVSWAELCDVFRSMIVMYAETGDPRFKYYVRGALDRWHTGFQADGYHTDENLDVFGETAGKAMRTGTHGPQDSFTEWAQPVGDTIFHVTAGRAAAIAFCRGTTALDVAEYRFREPAHFAFRITGSHPKPFPMVFSSPFRDLSEATVRVDGEPAGDLQVAGAYHEHLFFTVEAGAAVEIGEIKDAPARASAPAPAPKREPRRAWAPVLGLDCFDLAPHCNATVSQSWDDRDSWAGLPVGRLFAYEVPFSLVDPMSAERKVAVRREEGKEEAVIPLRHLTGGLFILASKLAANDLVVLLSNGNAVAVDPGTGLRARTGLPLQRWELWLYPLTVPPNADVDRLLVRGRATVFGVTAERSGQSVLNRVLQRAREGRRRAVAEAETQGAAERMVLECRRRVRAQRDRKAIRAAFLPPHGPAAPAIRDALNDLGIPSLGLRPEEIADPKLFTAADYPLVIYTGVEDYLRTVKQPGDGEAALLRYLSEGGTLLVMGPCRPFSYAGDLTAQAQTGPGEVALLGPKLGLDLLGPGEERGGSLGFEQPPAGHLTFRLEDDQRLLSGLPESFPFPRTGDRRYRPAVGSTLPAGDDFVPILTLYDQTGKRYGPAMALIRRHGAGFRGANLLWVWGTLLSPEFEHARTVLYQSLAAAAEMCGPASATAAVVAAGSPPLGATVAVLPPTSDDRTALVKRLCGELNADCAVVPPDVFVDATAFRPDRFPIAVYAPRNEAYLNAWRLPRDGAEAYVRYLDAGGFLIVCANATPFWYLLDYEQGGWRTYDPVEPTMPQAMGVTTAFGFEQPPAGMKLAAAPRQNIFVGLEPVTDVAGLGDRRWRGLVRVRGANVELTPLASLTDDEGNPYNGYAAALIRRHRGGGRPGTVLYLWGNLIEGELGDRLLRSALQFAMRDVQKTE